MSEHQSSSSTSSGSSSGSSGDSAEDIIKTQRLICEVCGETLLVPITASDINNQSGGIFRVATTHECTDGQRVHFLFFDSKLTLRQKVTTRVISTIRPTEGKRQQSGPSSVIVGSSPSLLLTRFKEETAKILASAMAGQQVVFYGSNLDEISQMVLGLKDLLPSIDLIFVPWTEEFSDADILGTTLSLSRSYALATKVDIDSRVVIDGIENSFCSALVETLLMTEPSVYAEVVKQYYSRLNYQLELLLKVRHPRDFPLMLAAMGYDGVDPDEATLALGIASQKSAAAGIFQNRASNVFSGTLIDIFVMSPDHLQSTRLEIQSSKTARLHSKLAIAFLDLIPQSKKNTFAFAELFIPRLHVIGYKGVRNIIFGFVRTEDPPQNFHSSIALLQSAPELLSDPSIDIAEIEQILRRISLAPTYTYNPDGFLSDFIKLHSQVIDPLYVPMYLRFYLNLSIPLSDREILHAIGTSLQMFPEYTRPRLSRDARDNIYLEIHSSASPWIRATLRRSPILSIYTPVLIVEISSEHGSSNPDTETSIRLLEFTAHFLDFLVSWVEDYGDLI